MVVQAKRGSGSAGKGATRGGQRRSMNKGGQPSPGKNAMDLTRHMSKRGMDTSERTKSRRMVIEGGSKGDGKDISKRGMDASERTMSRRMVINKSDSSEEKNEDTSLAHRGGSLIARVKKNVDLIKDHSQAIESLSRLAGELESQEDENEAHVEKLEPMPYGVVHPWWPRKFYWDMLVSVCILWSSMTVPFSLCFDVAPSLKCMRPIFIVDVFVDIGFVLDIILSFCTAYQDDCGSMITEHRLIAQRYFPNFIVDFVSTFPFDFVSNGFDITRACDGKRRHGSGSGGSNSLLRGTRLFRIIRLSKLFKLAKLSRLKRRKDDHLTTERSSGYRKFFMHPSLIAILQMIFQLFFSAHLLACFRHGLVVHDTENDTNWINKAQEARGGDTYSRRHAYLVSLYWAFTTMTTIGYGDSASATNQEKLLAMFAMIVGGASFGYIIGNITNLIANIDQKTTLYREKIDMVKEYVYDRQLPTATALKIVHHFKYMYSKWTVFDRNRVIDIVPHGLAMELTLSEYRNVIIQIPFLRNAPRQFVTEIAPRLIPAVAKDHQILFLQGDLGTHLYFIFSGSSRRWYHRHQARRTTISSDVPVTIDSFIDGYELPVARPGAILGSEALFASPDERHAYTAAAADVMLEYYVLAKQDIIFELECEPKPREVLIKDGEEVLAAIHTHLHHPESEEDEAVPTLSLPPIAQSLQPLNDTSPEKSPTVDQKKTSSTLFKTTGGIFSKKKKNECAKVWPGSAHEKEEESLELKENHSHGSLIFRGVAKCAAAAINEVGRMSPVTPKESTAGNDDELIRVPVVMSPKELWQMSWVVHPDASYKIAWDALICGLILTSVVIVTYRIGFGIEDKTQLAWIIQLFINMAFMIDILVAFNTAYLGQQQTTLIFDRHKIVSRYLSTWFVIDLMSSLPMEEYRGAGSQQLASFKLLKALRLVRIAKMTRFLKLQRLVDALEENLGVNPALLKPIKPMVITAGVAHIFACVFFFVGRAFRRCKYPSWIDATCEWKPHSSGANSTIGFLQNASISDDQRCFEECDAPLRNADRTTQYITTLYWAFATMTTVGYGDVVPSQDDMNSIVLVISCQVLGTMLFAYLIGVIIDLVANLDPMERKRKQSTDVLREFAIEQHLSNRMMKMIMVNHNFRNEVKGVDDEENEILIHLPPKLQNECALFVHSRSLAAAPLLCKLEEGLPGSIATLMPKLKPVAYIAEQVVNDRRINAREFHFVLGGRFKILQKFKHSFENNGQPKSSLREASEHFGASTILLPADEQFRLNLEITCISSTATAFVLHKSEFDDLGVIFSSIYNALEAAIGPESDMPEDQDEWLTVLSPSCQIHQASLIRQSQKEEAQADELISSSPLTKSSETEEEIAHIEQGST